MEIKIEDVGLFEFYGLRIPTSGKIKFAGQTMDDWPEELTINEIPGLELELVETEDDDMVLDNKVVQSKGYYRVK